MIQNNGGTIINIRSGGGKTGIPKFSAYCASKFGVMGFSESIFKRSCFYKYPRYGSLPWWNR